MKRNFAIFAALITLVLVTAACTGGQEYQTNRIVDDQQSWYNQYQPIPMYTFSLERSEAIQLYNARNDARNTYSYAFSYTGNILFGCPSRGFPLPYGVQLTNPVRVEYNTSGAVVDQPEPNGLYTTGISTAATWVSCARPQGVAPVYSEPDVMAFPFPVVEQNGRLVDAGQDSSITLDLTRPSNIPATMPSGSGNSGQ